MVSVRCPCSLYSLFDDFAHVCLSFCFVVRFSLCFRFQCFPREEKMQFFASCVQKNIHKRISESSPQIWTTLLTDVVSTEVLLLKVFWRLGRRSFGKQNFSPQQPPNNPVTLPCPGAEVFFGEVLTAFLSSFVPAVFEGSERSSD